jgi:predicted helicase
MPTEIVKDYISEVIKMFETGHAREHGYRPALKTLFEKVSGLRVVNDPKRSEHGAPDFIFLKDNNIVVAYAEAKDINVSLDETAKSNQMERYYGYSNLILTNSLEFRFYRNGQPYGEAIKIGELKANKITTFAENFTPLEDALKDFLKEAREPITSGVVLSKVMAGKARRIRDNIKTFLKTGDESKNQDLLSIYNAIKQLLLADLDYEKFADMYAQTVVYGLFVARYHDKTENTFSRQEARDLVPASNPFLRHFFDHIAGASFDKRIEFIVNELCEEFTHTDVRAIVHNYFKTEKDPSRDPIIHFYEDFLKEYNPKERMDLGVFYTPLPVVDFIVRSIDEILKRDFGLKGLADDSKIEITKQVQNKKVKEKIHKVQLLDPATGTGTFLNETILHIKKSFVGQEGRWPSYVKQELLPRLHGFELMMAPYTIAHLKLASTLKETGAELDNGRIGVYLTNSLEKMESKQKDLFNVGLGEAISEESREAGKVKNDLPIMVVFGNPPYSGISHNKHYTENNAYKVEPGGKERLKEKKNWLDDDYVKFIRFAESLIEKNQEGIVGMITSHGYIDNPTFRGMRWHLRDTFDAIYVLDLHGNSNRKEVVPKDGSKDVNVFDIKTGVSIFFGIKKQSPTKNKKLATVYQAEIYGLRESKQVYLNENSVLSIKWNKLPENIDAWQIEGLGKDDYEEGFSVTELFPQNSTGIVTMGDGFIIDEDKFVLEKRIQEFLEGDANEVSLKEKFGLGKNYAKWVIGNKVKIKNDPSKIIPLEYRPFDTRYTYFDKNLVWRTRDQVMENYFGRKNIGLLFSRMTKGKSFSHVFITEQISEAIFLSPLTGTNAFNAPLFIYAEGDSKYRVGEAGSIPVSRIPNIDLVIARQIAAAINAVYYPVAEYPTQNKDIRLTPENILDFVYAYLYSPSYREKYKEFLKSDFPRVPYPKNENQFFELAKLGEELRKLHLLESPKLSNFITTYSEGGSNEVEKVEFKDGKVYINETQYFGGVPKEAWEFYIGGYQPAQKWLKDRKSKVLSAEDIEHYQKIIISLIETRNVMKAIDKQI